MPNPRIGEGKEEFINRCMGDSEAINDFPARGQRFAFCNSVWESFEEDDEMEDYEEEFKEKKGEILKIDEEKRIVYGIVLEPEVEDSQGDIISAEEIEKTAHRFLVDSRIIGERHEYLAMAYPVESFIAPIDFDIGDQLVKKGTWVLVTKIEDEELWKEVKNGGFTGYSVGGFASRR